MAIGTRQFGVISIALLTICVMILSTGTDNVDFPEFTDNDMASMRSQIKDMFYHAYGNYMDIAFPADELKPISCKPRERGENRGSLDDVLGDFSLTLVDSLDMLLVLGDVDEFNKAVKAVITTVRFDKDVNVSVFETTIRILGGLLSAHLQAEEQLPEYKGELLTMSVDLADRLLPAFNTKTGIPYSRVNLMYGLIPKEKPESCTACAGTLIMEFGLLSKLTKNPVYETVAKEALKALYNRRSAVGLVATTINVNSGQWTSRDSGIGAGIDSYYEYLLKAYLMFGDEEYYHMFNVSYAAVMKHIKKDHFYTNVDLVSGQLKYNWIDSLSAFWPGLQVLAGDVPNAEQAWSKYYFAWRKHQVGLPERFDFLHLGATLKHYPLRPEFIESTYFLYQATKNPFYLHVGREIFNGLKTHTKTECGYATVTDVETKKLEDRMDSFFLSEVCKYLYLLFDPDNFVTKENFIFTTEGHFFPMQYGYLNTSQSKQPVTERCKMARKKIETIDDLTAPLIAQEKNKTRQGQCDIKEGKKARELNATAVNMPKYVITGLDPQLIGGIFVNLVPKSREAQLIFTAEGQQVKIYAGQAAFGPGVPPDGLKSHEVVQVQPSDGCARLITPLEWTQDRVVVVDRGNCPFVQKVFYAQRAGATAAIVVDNVPKNGIFMMVNNEKDEDEPEIAIPSVLISYEDGIKLRKHLIDPTLLVEAESDDESGLQDTYAHNTVTSLLPLRADLIPLGTREDDQRLEFAVETKQKVNQELFARAGIRMENNMIVFYTNEDFKFDDPRLGGAKDNDGRLPEGFTMNVMLDPRDTTIDLLHVDEYNKQQRNVTPTESPPETNNQQDTTNNKIDP